MRTVLVVINVSVHAVVWERTCKARRMERIGLKWMENDVLRAEPVLMFVSIMPANSGTIRSVFLMI